MSWRQACVVWIGVAALLVIASRAAADEPAEPRIVLKENVISLSKPPTGCKLRPLPTASDISADLKRVAYAVEMGQKSHVIVNDEVGPAYDDVGKPLFSPDSEHVAYAARKGEKWFVVVDGEEMGPYENVAVWTPHGDYAFVFSADSLRLAYVAQRNGKQFLVAGGKEGPGCDEVCDVGFSPDSSRLAYEARRGKKWFVMLDGEEGPSYDGIVYFRFSPDSERFSYRAWKEKGILLKRREEFLIVDGRKFGPYQQFSVYGPRVSPDGKRFAFSARDRRTGAEVVVIDGKEEPTPFEWVSHLSFSRDSKRLAYTGSLGWPPECPYATVVDGERITGYDSCYSLVFSPDSKHIAYVAEKEGRHFVVVDGHVGRPYEDIWWRPEFSADSSRVAYAAAKNGRMVAVVDGAEEGDYEGMKYGLMIFSPNSARYAYAATKGPREFVVVDGKRYRSYEEIYRVEFSPDSARFAYTAREGKEWIVGTDGAELGSRFLHMLRGPKFDEAGTLCAVAVREPGHEFVRLEVEIEGVGD